MNVPKISAFSLLIGSVGLVFTSTSTLAQNDGNCRDVPNHSQLKTALGAAQNQTNGGFGLEMWGTIVNRDGVVCAVAFTGSDRGSQWPGSRVISAQKANTANAFSLPDLVLSTAILFSAVQPGGSLYGLQHSNPVETEVAYKGPSSHFGQPNDPMVGSKIGGVNVFGGGLALYKTINTLRTLVGALGVSGDSSCADHYIAWKTRFVLNLDSIPGGVGPSSTDNIAFDISPDAHNHPVSTGGWGHPNCNPAFYNSNPSLLVSHPVGPNP